MKFLTYLFFLFAFLSGGTCALIDNSSLPPDDIFSTKKEQFQKSNTGVGFCGVSYSSKNNNTAEISLGKTLFKNQCASCHNKNMKDDLTGPALEDVEKRWAKYPKEDLYNWIRNSQKMIEEGHPRAMELWQNWKPYAMNFFPNLTDEDIENILKYIKLY